MSYLGNPRVAMVRQDRMPVANYEVAGNPTVDVNPAFTPCTWLNVLTGEIWLCTDNTPGSNVWFNANCLATLRTGLLFFFDGEVDGGGNPVDRTGNFTATKRGSFTTSIESSGPLKGRQVFSLNGTDADVLVEDSEELRLTGDLTFAMWGKVASDVDFTTTQLDLISCTSSGETLSNNYLYGLKHEETLNGNLATFHEYGNGANISSYGSPDFAYKDEWYFLVASRQAGLTWNTSLYRNSTSAWTHGSIVCSHVPEKDYNAVNTQRVILFNEAGMTYYKGLCGGVGLWNRALGRRDRLALLDNFFLL